VTRVLERTDRPEASVALTQLWDANELGIVTGTLIIPNSARQSNRIPLVGFRRYRFKWRITDDGGGVSAMQLQLFDVPFSRVFSWQTVTLGPFPYGANGANVQNYGEGTAVLQSFLGTFHLIVLRNLGPANVRIQDCELWAGA